MNHVRRLLQLLAVGAAARAALLFYEYRFAIGNVRSHHVESAATVFVLLGAALMALVPRGRDRTGGDAEGSRAEGLLWLLGAVILYWPALSIGLLSDDLVLAARARHLEIGLVHREFFRPLPLAIWSVVMPVAGPVGLHGLNVLAHGAVAFLTARLARPYAGAGWIATVAGLIVLTFPAAVEAVAWSSGIFDVSATLLVVLAVLAARRYGDHTTRSTRVALGVCATLAVLCKETAIVVPVLLLVDAWARRSSSRTLFVDLGGLGVLLGTVAIVRWSMASELVRKPITRYLLQRWLFGTVGGLSVPWHVSVLRDAPWLAVLLVVCLLGLCAAFVVSRTSDAARRAVVLGGSWVLIGTLPAVTFLFIGEDLQGSRYLYLPLVGFAVLLSALCAGLRRFQAAGGVALAAMVVAGAWGVRWHLAPWQRAGAVRDAALASAAASPDLRRCQAAALLRLPDAVDGAYVFRNGSEEAFASIGVTLGATVAAGCRFEWDGRSLVPAGAAAK